MVQCLLQIGHQVFTVFDSDGDSDQTVGDSKALAPLPGDRCVSHGRRMGDQCLDAPEAFGEAGQLDTVQNVSCVVEVAGLKCNHGSKSILLTFGQLVLGVSRKSGVENALYAWMASQECSHLSTIFFVRLHSHSQCLDTPQHQPGIERAEDGSCGILNEVESIRQFLIIDDQHSSNTIAMAVQELGRTVDDYGGLQVRSGAAGTGTKTCCRPQAARLLPHRCG